MSERSGDPALAGADRGSPIAEAFQKKKLSKPGKNAIGKK